MCSKSKKNSEPRADSPVTTEPIVDRKINTVHFNILPSDAPMVRVNADEKDDVPLMNCFYHGNFYRIDEASVLSILSKIQDAYLNGRPWIILKTRGRIILG